MRTKEWSDEMGARSRASWLLLIKGEEIRVFRGESVPGVVVVRGTDYNKNGKWSHTTYRLELGEGVRAIAGLNGWETGRFVEGLRSAVGASAPVDTWTDVAEALGVSVVATMGFLRSWRPKAAAALDEVDAKLQELDEVAEAAGVDADTETVVVSFGGPTRRAMAEGFWESPKPIPGHVGELRLIDKERGWSEKTNIRVAGIAGTVVNVTTSDGYHGGYVAVTVAVVPGTSFDEAPEPQVPISDEEATERERLKDLLAWEAYGSTPLADDLSLARRIDAFVKDAVEERGQKAYNLLREEMDEDYGRKSRTIGISEKFPGIMDHRGLDWAAGCDIVPATFWAGRVLANAPKPVASPPVVGAQPATAERVSASLADLQAKFGKRCRKPQTKHALSFVWKHVREKVI